MGILFSFHDELRYTLFLYRPPLAYCFCCRRSSSSFFFLFCCVRRYHSLRTFLCLKILLHKTSLPLGLGQCVRWNKKKRIYTYYFFIMILYHYFLKVYRIKNTLSNRGVYQKKWTQLSLDACFKIFSHIFHRQTRGDKKTPSPTPIASQALYHHHGRQWPICKRKKQWTAFV